MQLGLLFYVPFTYTILREAAKAVGVWDFAPYLEEISSDMMKFRETVCYSTMCIYYQNR